MPLEWQRSAYPDRSSSGWGEARQATRRYMVLAEGQAFHEHENEPELLLDQPDAVPRDLKHPIRVPGSRNTFKAERLGAREWHKSV